MSTRWQTIKLNPESRARLATLAFLFVLLSSSAPGEIVRVATCNLRNYLITDRMVESRYRPQYPKPEDEKLALWKVFHLVDPDILAIQEIGSLPFLNELRQDLLQAGLDFPHFSLLSAEDEERHITVLSRIPFEEISPQKPLQFRYFGGIQNVKRGLMALRFTSQDESWTLFNVHLKSKRTIRKDDPESALFREREATAIRNFIRSRFKDHPDPLYLLAGDINDTVRSKAVRRLTRVGDQILSHPVPAADTRGETWTYHYRSEDTYTRIDFFLVSPSLNPYIRRTRGYVVDTAEMLSGSDHRLIYLDLEFNP